VSVNRILRLALTATFVLGIAASVRSSARAGDDLLSRMIALNPGVHAFQASIHSDVHMLSFPFLSPSLEGTYYHKNPSLDKLVFTSGVPAIAKEFSQIYPRIEGPADWNAVYEVSKIGDDGTTTTFRLVPHKHGRVDHLDVTVDDATAGTTSFRWSYNDGSGFAEMRQSYAMVDGHYMVVRQSGHVEQQIYKADIESTLDHYKFNPPLTDDFFRAD
jgi:hypothetical protein